MKPIYPLIGLGLALLLSTGCGSDSNNDSPPHSSSSSSSSSSESSSSSSSSEDSNDEDSNDEGPGNGWTLVWQDEFEGDAIDADKWSHEVNCAGGGNNELQCYTPRDANSYVADGRLHIVAQEESFSGPPVFDDDPEYNPDDTSATKNYTSARLRSKGKGDWRYGRMEIRAQMPQGQGVWPAIWMMPTHSVYGAWPMSGEIDIFEAVNSNTDAGGNETHGTLHYGGFWPSNVHSGEAYTPEEPIWENFHTYAVEWEEGEIRWYVDDVHFATQTSAGWYNVYRNDNDEDKEGFVVGEGAAPFDEHFHLIMNVAVGGNWPGSPNEATSFPQEMIVDYVRVYECSADPETGKGCATDVNDAVEPLPGHTPPEPRSISLYQDGATTLTFEVADNTVENTLQPQFYDAGVPGNVVSSENDGNWVLQFNGAGNAFLSSESMADQEGVEDGVQFVNMEQYGELRFDLKVDALSDDTELHIKVDSGWPNVSYQVIEVPPLSEWAAVTVALADLMPNNIEPGAVNLATVMNPFVIESVGGTAELQLNHIHLRCMGDCAVQAIPAGVSPVLDASFDVFVDGEPGVNWDFGVGTWDNDSGSVAATVVEDAERGEVLNIAFSGAQNGLMFVQSTSPKDASAFVADGQLVFDIKVISYGTNTEGLVVKAESGPSTGTGDLVLTPTPPVGEWTTITLPIADMVNHPGTHGNFRIDAFNTPFVFLPAWDNQAGVEVQLDNIRWTR